MACLTNYLTSSEESSSEADCVNPILTKFWEHLDSFCASRASTLFAVAPPSCRVSPYWYSVGLPEILIEFSSVVSARRPDNLRIMSSFNTPELQACSIHFTPYSGLRYVVH